jgi:hypothetical protein
VRVNRGGDDWNAAQHVLPQYGFYARVPAKEGVLEAAIERRDGLIAEWSKVPGVWYVNARRVVPEAAPGRGGAGGRGSSGPDPQLPRMNPDGRVVNFGVLSTNGGFRLIHAGGALELVPLPSSPSFQANIRWRDLTWKLDGPKEMEALDRGGRVLRRLPLKMTNGEILITSELEVFSYRLR